jgi:hypothetical protein
MNAAHCFQSYDQTQFSCPSLPYDQSSIQMRFLEKSSAHVIDEGHCTSGKASVIKNITTVDFLSGFCNFLNLCQQMVLFVLLNIVTCLSVTIDN